MSSKNCVVKRMSKAQKGKFMNEFEFFDIEVKETSISTWFDWWTSRLSWSECRDGHHWERTGEKRGVFAQPAQK